MHDEQMTSDTILKLSELENSLDIVNKRNRLRSIRFALKHPETCSDTLHLIKLQREERGLLHEVRQFEELTQELIRAEYAQQKKAA